MMVGKTRETLQFNCCALLDELTGGQFKCSPKANTGWLYGHEVRLIGASDEKATAKIKGSTLAGVYVDELTEIPESFYQMCLSRLSRPRAVFLATTNPDSPRSYVYTDIIQNDEIDRKVWTFLLDDNTFLDPAYVANIKREYTGVFYERYILSKWALAEGLVYPRYDNTVEATERAYSEFCVSMDYGTMNPTAMLLWGRTGGDTWYCIREYYHSGRDTQELKTDMEYYEELERLCEDVPAEPGGKIQLIIDPSAASFIAVVQKHHRFKVRKADNDVLNGIRNVSSALTQGKIWFNDCCKNTIEEFGLYSWDDRATVDTVIKANDHCLSADTMVHTLFGKRRIKDLLGKRGWVWSYDERKRRKVLRRFHDVRQTGKDREMLRITFANGKTVECTPDHLILTQRGWIEAGKLDTTDYAVDIMNTK
jgi:Terminase-like family.